MRAGLAALASMEMLLVSARVRTVQQGGGVIHLENAQWTRARCAALASMEMIQVSARVRTVRQGGGVIHMAKAQQTHAFHVRAVSTRLSVVGHPSQFALHVQTARDRQTRVPQVRQTALDVDREPGSSTKAALLAKQGGILTVSTIKMDKIARHVPRGGSSSTEVHLALGMTPCLTAETAQQDITSSTRKATARYALLVLISQRRAL